MKPKELRSQLRNVVKELLPDLLASDFNAANLKTLEVTVDKRIKELEDFVKKTLTEINDRHKDTMGYLVRQVTSAKGNNEKI